MLLTITLPSLVALEEIISVFASIMLFSPHGETGVCRLNSHANGVEIDTATYLKKA